MGDVGEKLGLQLGGAAQVVGAFIQFGIQGDDAAVGVLQFAVQQFQLFLAAAQLLKVFSSSWFCCSISS